MYSSSYHGFVDCVSPTPLRSLDPPFAERRPANQPKGTDNSNITTSQNGAVTLIAPRVTSG